MRVTLPAEWRTGCEEGRRPEQGGLIRKLLQSFRWEVTEQSVKSGEIRACEDRFEEFAGAPDMGCERKRVVKGRL